MTQMDAFKKGGIDEEKAKPYKMIFQIWPLFGMSAADPETYKRLEGNKPAIQQKQTRYLQAIQKILMEKP